MTDPPELEDDEIVTQFVFKGADPQVMPRTCDTDGLSLLRGQLTPAEAGRYVRFRVHQAWVGDGVRFARVGDLRAAGIEVKATPSARIAIHVSVTCEAEWTQDVGNQFGECFGHIVRQEGGE